MNTLARYIKMIMLVVIAVVGMTGCKASDLFAPKTMFYGTIKNNREYRLNVPNPANQPEVHTLDPGSYFSCELEGSREYVFRATLPDGTIYSEFTARINQLSKDATINNVKVDWTWVIGGPFMACVTPVGGGDASDILFDISSETDSAQATPSLMHVSAEELRQVRDANDHNKMVKLITTISQRHGVSNPYSGQEVK